MKITKKTWKISLMSVFALATVVLSVIEVLHMVSDGTRFMDANPILLIVIIIFGGILSILSGCKKEDSPYWAMIYTGACSFIACLYYSIGCATHGLSVLVTITYLIVGLLMGGVFLYFGIDLMPSQRQMNKR